VCWAAIRLQRARRFELAAMQQTPKLCAPRYYEDESFPEQAGVWPLAHTQSWVRPDMDGTLVPVQRDGAVFGGGG